MPRSGGTSISGLVAAEINRLTEQKERYEGPATGALSTQVLQEFDDVGTRTMTLQPVLARRVVACYAAWPVVETTPQLIVSASLLHERHGFAYGDAMVVEAALLSGATTLLSETCRTGAGSGPDDPEPVFVLIRSSS